MKKLLLIVFAFLANFIIADEAFDKLSSELESFTAKVGKDQLQLMAGYKWNQYKRVLKNADKFVQEKKLEEAKAKYKEALSLAKSFVENCKIHRLNNGDMKMGEITLHAKTEEIAFPAYVEVVEDMPIEVLICTDNGRMHETIFISKARPFHLQTMMIALGLKNGARVVNEKFKKQGDHVKIEVEWKSGDKVQRKPIEHFLIDENNKTLDPAKPRWVFVGSGLHKGSFIADLTGDFAVNYTMADSIIDCSEDDIANMKTLLSSKFPKDMKSKTKVRIIISKWK